MYDLSGNLTFLARNDSSETTVDFLTYTPVTGTNRLASLSDQVPGSTWDAKAGSFAYDANGNMLKAPEPYAIDTATYDHMNLPTKFRRDSDSTLYRYSAEGQRIAKRVNTGNIQVYILDGRTTLAFYILNNSTGAIVSSHNNIVVDDRVVGRQVAGVKRYYHTDMLGSTRAVVEGVSIVESYDYDPWGVLLEGRVVAGPTKEGFTGKERDAETGLDYFGFRHYMPAIGRWTTVDPPADSFPSWSPYNYVYNNPVLYSDPFGLCPGKPKSGTICLAFFVRSRTTLAGVLRGDNRGFSAFSAPDRSRAYAIVDPARPASAQTRLNPTCWGFGNGCAGPLKSTRDFNHLTVTPTEEGGFRVQMSVTNALVPGPSIDADLTFTRGEDGSWSVSGSRDGYPSFEAYYYGKDGSVQTIIQQLEGKPRELWGCCDTKVNSRR